jgi:chromosome segregation and condensation protein ScpB
VSHIVLGQDAHHKNVTLDLAKLVRTRMLIAANSGGGKSWAIRRLLEQTHGKIQQIVLDYEGEFATLREQYDFVLVGKGGELAADPRYAPQLARRLLELGASAIIDLYELKVDDRHEFVKRFLEALVNLPKELWKPCLVVVDEAHVVCPEHGKGESVASGAVIDLTTRGRKRAFCAVLATQDVAKLNKDASGECRNRLIGLAVEDKTRKRAGEELGFVEKSQVLSLRTLEPGDFYTFGPAIGNEVRKVHIGPVQTSHPDVGTKAGRALLASPPPPPEKVKAILSKLADLPKEAEEEQQSLAALRRRVVELERELKAKPQVSVPAPVRVDVPIITDAQVKKFEQASKLFADTHIKFQQTVTDALRRLEETTAQPAQIGRQILDAVAAVRSNGARPPVPIPSRPVAPAPHTAVRAPAATSASTVIASPGKGERVILAAVAQHPDGVTREQLTVLTGYKRSSRDTYLQRLQVAGNVMTSGGRIHVTEEGVTALGSDYAPLPTGRALQDYWLKRLPTGEKVVLEVVLLAYPQPVDREAISEATGYKRSSRDTYLQRLASRELITTDRGTVKVSDMLFDGGER